MSRENIHRALMKLLQTGAQALSNNLGCQSVLEITADGNSSVNHPVLIAGLDVSEENLSLASSFLGKIARRGIKLFDTIVRSYLEELLDSIFLGKRAVSNGCCSKDDLRA